MKLARRMESCDIRDGTVNIWWHSLEQLQIRAKNTAPTLTAKTHPWLKQTGSCLIKIQTGKHVTMEVLHWINTSQSVTVSMQKCRQTKCTASWWEADRNQCVVEQICSQLFTVNDSKCRLCCHFEISGSVHRISNFSLASNKTMLDKHKTIADLRQLKCKKLRIKQCMCTYES